MTTVKSTLHEYVTTVKSTLHEHVTTVKSTLHEHVTTVKSTLHEHVCTIRYIGEFFFRMKGVPGKLCGENQNTLSTLKFSLFSGNRAVYEIIWKNILDRRQATDDNMAHAHFMLGT